MSILSIEPLSKECFTCLMLGFLFYVISGMVHDTFGWDRVYITMFEGAAYAFWFGSILQAIYETKK